MKKLLFVMVAVLAGAFALTAQAAPRYGYFDHSTNTWVTPKYHPGGPSPVKRKRVKYDGPYPAGTIVIDTSERRLYHVLPGGKAMKYGVGVGKDGFQWAGTHRITRKLNGRAGPRLHRCVLVNVRKAASFRLTCRVDRTTRWVLARCTSARHSTAFTARLSRGPSVRLSLPAVSVWQMKT